MATRREADLIGERDIAADALMGIHTARTRKNFPLTGRPCHPELIKAYAAVKIAAAKTNHRLSFLADDVTEAIVRAAYDSFLDVGYARTTYQRIADLSGFERTLVQYHAPKKDDLAQQFLAQVLAAVEAAVVEHGLGIGCISRLALREAFRRGSLVAIETPELDLRRDFQFVWHRRKFQTAGMREFVDLCRQKTAGVTRSDEIDWPYIP